MAQTIPTEFADLPTIDNVSFPVGLNKHNAFDDVLLVQNLMKMADFVRSNGAGPIEASRNITVDGKFGPQTARMIKAFEADRKSARLLLSDDGVVESSSKDGFTSKGFLFKIVHLNRAAKHALQFDFEFRVLPFLPTTHPALRKSLEKGATRPIPSKI